MGKSSHSQDRGAPRRNPKDNDEDEFDWREEMRKQKIEEDRIKNEEESEEIFRSLEDHYLNKNSEGDKDGN